MKSDVWYKIRGFDVDPFSIEPSNFIIGLDQQIENIKTYVNSGNVCMLFGSIGSGKTTVSKVLSDDLKSNYHIAYINGDLIIDNQKLNIDNAVKKPLLASLLNKKTFLIVDEAQNLHQENLIKLKGLWDTRAIHSILFIQIEPKLENAPESFRNRIGQRAIQTEFLTQQQMMELIKKRIGEIRLFNKDALSYISKYSNNPREVLEFCSNICNYYSNEETINLDNVFSFNKLFKKNKGISVNEMPSKKEEIKQNEVKELDLIDSQNKIINFLLQRTATLDQIAQGTSLSNGNVRQQIARIKKKYDFIIKEDKSSEDKKIKIFSLQQPYERSICKK